MYVWPAQGRVLFSMLIYCFSWTIFTFLEAKQRSPRRLSSSVTSTLGTPRETSLPLKAFSFFNRRTALLTLVRRRQDRIHINCSWFTISSASGRRGYTTI